MPNNIIALAYELAQEHSFSLLESFLDPAKTPGPGPTFDIVVPEADAPAVEKALTFLAGICRVTFLKTPTADGATAFTFTHISPVKEAKLLPPSPSLPYEPDGL